jgi:hypothetical protein
MNAQTGKDDVYYPIIGQHILHNISNDNGQRLIGFAASRGIVIGCTLFCRKNIHEGKWKNPYGPVINLIDRVWIDMRRKSSLMDVRSFRGSNRDSDNFLVMSKFCSRVSNCKRGKRAKLKRCTLINWKV